MSISCAKQPESESLTIGIKGCFDSSLTNEFQKAYEENAQDIKLFEIDLKETSRVDSSALGALILLNRFASDRNAVVSIKNPNASVKWILKVSNFSWLFKIDE